MKYQGSKSCGEQYNKGFLYKGAENAKHDKRGPFFGYYEIDTETEKTNDYRIIRNKYGGKQMIFDKANILVVEDDPDLSDFLTEIFNSFPISLTF